MPRKKISKIQKLEKLERKPREGRGESIYGDIFEQIAKLKVGEFFTVHVGSRATYEEASTYQVRLAAACRRPLLRAMIEERGKLKFKITHQNEVAVCLEEG